LLQDQHKYLAYQAFGNVYIPGFRWMFYFSSVKNYLINYIESLRILDHISFTEWLLWCNFLLHLYAGFCPPKRTGRGGDSTGKLVKQYANW
jgi:hypothetical protein